ncbi:MAG TPA: hypothetical protein VMF30_16520 [Pirellulales bacterium]|nr:hypothetical protein [Pirellulales bacterium]
MKTFFKRAAAALVLGLLPVGMASAQVTVTTPPAGGAGGVNVQAGPANVQTGPGGTAVTLPPGTGEAVRENAAARQENRAVLRGDRLANRQTVRDWRMQNYRNRWWYYHPNNTWSYYEGSRWIPYRTMTNQPAMANQTAPDANRRYSAGYRGTQLAPADANTLPNATANPAQANPAQANPAPSTK